MSDLVYHAISDQHRRKILQLIQDRELSAGEIASHFSVTQPAISQHLKVLRDAGLVVVRQDGTRRLYRTRPAGLTELREFLESFWDASLIELKHAAEQEEREMKGYGRN
jgi:DNA-binding transcriptional ArsR family regulator